jgi:hypothetical protein
VLVGEDSLEANVGHLAALTGGEIFVTAGIDLTSMMHAAIRALRVPRETQAAASEPVRRVSIRQGGMLITARWDEAGANVQASTAARSVTAFAANLALPLLPSEAAAKLAEAEGLVSHLTSLILVDEAAQGEIVLPATRKVPLPEPRTAAKPALLLRSLAPAAPRAFRQEACAPSSYSQPVEKAVPRAAGANAPPAEAEGAFFSFGRLDSRHASPAHRPQPPDLVARINWNAAPAKLKSGDLSVLDQDIARLVREAAARPQIVELARKLGLDAIVLVIALLARAASPRSRSAARIARAILGGVPENEIAAAATLLGSA